MINKKKDTGCNKGRIALFTRTSLLMVFSFFQLVVNEEPDLSPLSPDHGIAVDLVIPDCIALAKA